MSRRQELDATTRPDAEGFFEVWEEGYANNDTEGVQTPAQLAGRFKAATFGEACDLAMAGRDYYGQDVYNRAALTYWACRLFPDEARAREHEPKELDPWTLLESAVALDVARSEKMVKRGIVLTEMTPTLAFRLIAQHGEKCGEKPKSVMAFYDRERPAFQFAVEGLSQDARVRLAMHIFAVFKSDQNVVIEVIEPPLRIPKVEDPYPAKTREEVENEIRRVFVTGGYRVAFIADGDVWRVKVAFLGDVSVGVRDLVRLGEALETDHINVDYEAGSGPLSDTTPDMVPAGLTIYLNDVEVGP